MNFCLWCWLYIYIYITNTTGRNSEPTAKCLMTNFASETDIYKQAQKHNVTFQR